MRNKIARIQVQSCLVNVAKGGGMKWMKLARSGQEASVSGEHVETHFSTSTMLGRRLGRMLTGLVSLAILAGCSSPAVLVYKVDDTQPHMEGVPYNLAMTQFTVTFTRSIVECGAKPKTKVEMLATSAPVLDRDNRYVLDAKGTIATADLTSTIGVTGISKGLNASSAGAGPAIVSAAVGAIAQAVVPVAAAHAAVVPAFQQEAATAGEAITAAEPVKTPCTADVAAAVARLYPGKGGTPQQKKVDADTAAVASATSKVNLYTTLYKGDKTLLKSLLAAVKDQTTAQDKLNADTAVLNQDLAATTSTDAVIWPMRSNVVATQAIYKPADKLLKDWFGTKVDDSVAEAATKALTVALALYQHDDAGLCVAPASLPPTLEAPNKPAATANANPLSSIQTSSCGPGSSDCRLLGGVPYRVALPARLVACFGGMPCPTEAISNDDLKDDARYNSSADVPVLQLGKLNTAHVAGSFWKAEGINASFDDSGNLASLEISEKTAADQAIASTLKDAATQISAIPGQIAAYQLSATQAQTAQLTANSNLIVAQGTAASQAQITGLTTQANILNAQAGLSTATLAAGAVAQTAAVTDQVGLATAQASLLAATANAGVNSQVSALNAQASLINAQAATVNAQVTLNKAQAALNP